MYTNRNSLVPYEYNCCKTMISFIVVFRYMRYSCQYESQSRSHKSAEGLAMTIDSNI